MENSHWTKIENCNDFSININGVVRDDCNGTIKKQLTDKFGNHRVVIRNNENRLVFIIVEDILKQINNQTNVQQLSDCKKNNSLANIQPSKKVQQLDLDGNLIAEFNSVREVERQLNFKRGQISNCCIGKKANAYGYIWRYA